MSADITPVLNVLSELETMIVTELKELGIIDTPLARHDFLLELKNDLEEEMPDSLAKRSMLVVFDWYAENLMRESRFEDPIPTE